MGLEFKSNKIRDVLIFSGLDPDYRQQVPKNLVGQAASNALADLESSYKKYKEKLNLKYGQFLQIVEDNLPYLNNAETPSMVRNCVAIKLSVLARQYIQQEKNLSTVHKFFHKIGQLFKGHGFKTEGEWGLELASKIRSREGKVYKERLEKAIYHSFVAINETSPRSIINHMKDEINGLEDAQFKDVLADVIFKKKEACWGEKNKFLFYKNLSTEKRNIFEQELIARKDWYEQAFDIIEGADDKEFAPFISSNMLKRFQANPSQIINTYKNEKDKNGWYQRFFQTIVEKSVKEYLAENSIEGFKKIDHLLNDHWQIIDIKKIVNEPRLLTPEEIKKLRDNVNLHLIVDI